MNIWRQRAQRSRRRGDRGFTLIEVLMSLVLSGMIAAVVTAAILTSLSAAKTTTAQVNDSADAGLISAFLVRDAQSAGGINPTTALPEVGLGVSNDPSDQTGSGCASSNPQEKVPVVLFRFSWIDRSAPATTTTVVSYSVDAPFTTDPATPRRLTRRVCTYDTNGVNTTKVDAVLGRSVLSATAKCEPTSCAGNPDAVTLRVKWPTAQGEGDYLLTASLRSAASELTIVSPKELPAGQVGKPYTVVFVTTIGGLSASPDGTVTTQWGWVGASPKGLPPGTISIATANTLTDTSSGIISGIPTVVGVYPVRVTVTDAMLKRASRDYTITIHDPPVAKPDNASVEEDRVLTVAAPGVLANDANPEGNPITAILYSGVANGTLSFSSTGAYVYTPRPNFNGTDSFRYKISDGSLGSNIETVTLAVSPVNDAPVNRVPAAQQTSMNINKVFANKSRISISDVDAGTAIVQLQLKATNGTVTLPAATGLASSVGSGTAAMTITGTIININLSLVGAVFTPGIDFSGSATLQIVTSDQGNTGSGGILSDSDDVAITVNAVGIFMGFDDVGGTGRTGSSSYSGSTYVIAAGKAGVGGTADDFQFLYGSMTGNGRLTARVVSLDANGNGSAQAGVMFRETLDPGSRQATMDNTDGNGAEFLYRQTPGQATTVSKYPGTPSPYWVRLTRVGNVIAAERSADGVQWVASPQATITMAPTIYIGLAVSAHSNSVKLASAVFDNVSISTPPIAAADSYSVNEDATLSVDALTGVLDNDADLETDALTAILVSGTAGLTLNADGSFAYVPPTNFAGTASFTYVANDSVFNSVPVTVTLVVNAANEVPSFTGGPNQTSGSNLGMRSIAGWATAITQGAGETDQLFDFIVTNTNNSLFSVQPTVSPDGILTYAAAAATTGTATVSISLHDNGGTGFGATDTSAAQTFTITIDDPPVVTTTGAGLTYIENGTTVLDPGITITDTDNANLISATVTMTTNYANGQDTLGFVNQNGIVGTWTAATGVLNLSGSAAVSGYEAALRSITYNNNSDTPNTATRTVTFIASDSLLISNAASRTITVAAVNDAPVLAATAATLAYTENASTAVDGGLLVTDVDSANVASATAKITVGYVNGQDTLAFATQTGISGTWIPATGTLALSGSATVADYQAALRSITYNDNSHSPNTALRTVTFAVNDGALDSSATTRTITVTAVNDAPVNSVPGSQTTPKNITKVFSTGNGNLISISDADAGSNLVQVQLVSTNGTASLSSTTGLAFTAGDGTADATMTFTGAVTNVNLRLAGMSFIPTTTFIGAANLRIVTSDQGFSGTGGILSKTDNIAIIVDTAPVVTATVASQAYIENGVALAVDSAITVSDTDLGNLSSATVTMTTGYSNGQDVLSLAAQPVIVGTWNAATGTMSLTGVTTITGYQTALKAIKYVNTSQSPSTAPRTVTFAVNDGLLASNTASRTITVATVNDAPLNAIPANQSIARNAFKTLTFSTSDLDAGSSPMLVQLISTRGTTTLSGTTGLTFSVGDGTADGTMTFTGTIANINTAMAGLTFTASGTAGAGSLQIITSDQGATGTGNVLTDNDTMVVTVT